MPLNNQHLVNKVKLILKCFTFYIAIIAYNNTLFADDFHYNNMLIGDRASGMAGSYVAISDDPSGLFYNPAGIIYAVSSNISANMNAYNISQTHYKNVLGGQDWVRSSSALVPNFFGITQPLGPGTLGFSYAVTDSILEDQDQTFNDIPTAGTKFTINFNNQDTTNNIGPSYAISINEHWSIGLTIYGYYRSQEQIFSQNFDFPETEADPQDIYHWESSYVSLSEYGIKPVFGIIYTPMEKLSLGLTISKVSLFKSELEVQLSCATTYITEQTDGALCQPSEFSRFAYKRNEKREFPWMLNTGAAYFVNNRLLFSTSLWIYEAVNKTTTPLINAAAAMEYYLSNRFALRLGAYTNMANTPKLKNNVVNEYNEHIDIFGGTISLSHFTRSSAISIGFAGNLGYGKAQVISDNANIQDVRYYGISMFISASNSF